jgi:NAD-dependent DNA ligase
MRYIVLTGRHPSRSRRELVKECRDNGLVVQDKVDRRTDTVIASRFDTRKASAGKDNSIRVLPYAALEQIIGRF